MRRLVVLLIAGIVCVTSSVAVRAQNGDSFDLSWSTINGGGGMSAAGEYSLRGTIAQLHTDTMAEGPYRLSGGFWHRPVCIVALEDLVQFASGWLDEGTSLPGDFDGDEKVILVDFAHFASYWLADCPPDWPW